jgi:ureidoglycolate lyase
MSTQANEVPTAMKRLTVRPLTAEAFRPYGEVIDSSGNPTFLANSGAAQVHRDLAAIDVGANGGRICLSIVRTTPAALPLRITVMERHPLGSQAFVPLDGSELLLVVAPEGELDPAAIVAFQGSPSQGVNYRRGVWHHPLIALHRASDFVVVERAGEGENLNLSTLADSLTIDSLLPAAAPRES